MSAPTTTTASDEEFVRSPPNTPAQSKTESPTSEPLPPKPHRTHSKRGHDIGAEEKDKDNEDAHVDKQRRADDSGQGNEGVHQRSKKQRSRQKPKQAGGGDNLSATESSSEKNKRRRPKSSLFVKHIATHYPILTATYNEVNSRLPISIPNPTELPIINRLPSPARLPIISSIDAKLDSILTRLDTAFPVLTSSPEHFVSQVAQITDPWVAPANSWLVEHLPQSTRSVGDGPAIRERRKAQRESWATSVAPGEKSYADTAAASQDADKQESSKDDEDVVAEMELRKTVAILMDALDAQIQKAEEARGYIAEVLLPGYVPIVGGWLGGKVKAKGKEAPGKKTGDGERSGQEQQATST